ncbi:hypothetical protein LguiA_006960 [Lonicera macranthoides]
MDQEKDEIRSFGDGRESSIEEDKNVLRFLDSMDAYLHLVHSLSSTLRQGWLELASARHSMGTSRISGALFDLKHHTAATSLQVKDQDVSTSNVAGSANKQADFTLLKWGSPVNCKIGSGEAKFEEDALLKRKSNSSQLRQRAVSQHSEIQEKRPEAEGNGSPVTIDNQVQKERSKSLSVFGALVSPKLRAAQVSFETGLLTKRPALRTSHHTGCINFAAFVTCCGDSFFFYAALETLVEIANMQSSMLCAYDQVHKEMVNTTGGTKVGFSSFGPTS